MEISYCGKEIIKKILIGRHKQLHTAAPRDGVLQLIRIAEASR